MVVVATELKAQKQNSTAIRSELRKTATIKSELRSEPADTILESAAIQSELVVIRSERQAQLSALIRSCAYITTYGVYTMSSAYMRHVPM